jgi:hypothetical protein
MQLLLGICLDSVYILTLGPARDRLRACGLSTTDAVQVGLNIDTAAALVEGAGRYLLRTPATRVRMENMLQVCWSGTSMM